MSSALWKGLIGLLSVVLMFAIYYLYKGIRFLISNPKTIKYWFDSFKKIIKTCWEKLFPERKMDSVSDIDKSKVTTSSISTSIWGKKTICFLLGLVCFIGIGFGLFLLFDMVIVPNHNTKIDQKLIEQAKINPSIADKNAITLYNRSGHKCNLYHEYQEFKLLEFGARNGNVMAQLYLGIMYESKYIVKYGNGYGVVQNMHIDWANTSRRIYHTESVDKKKLSEIEMLEHAAYWFTKASDAGNMDARGRLGICYLLGNGVEYNPSVGERLIQEAADNGIAQFQYYFGNLLEKGLIGAWIDGDGTIHYFREEPRIEEAKLYWRLAANQGVEEAALKLEKLY